MHQSTITTQEAGQWLWNVLDGDTVIGGVAQKGENHFTAYGNDERVLGQHGSLYSASQAVGTAAVLDGVTEIFNS